jgi:hypothetical protein
VAGVVESNPRVIAPTSWDLPHLGGMKDMNMEMLDFVVVDFLIITAVE